MLANDLLDLLALVLCQSRAREQAVVWHVDRICY